MADHFYPSDDISVFPSVYRTYNPSGKFTNETNFAGIVKSIVDKDSYVVSFDSNKNILRIVVFGYYFVINNVTTIPPWVALKLESDLYANCYNLVNFDDGSTQNFDTGGRFKGLYVADVGEIPPTTSELFKVLIIKNSNSEKLNYKRLSSDSVYYEENGISQEDAKTITEKIDSKQDALEPGAGLFMYDSNNTKYIEVVPEQLAKLDSLNGDSMALNTAALITFDENGLKKIPEVTVGKGYGSTETAGIQSAQSVWVSDGIISPNVTIYYSTDVPNITGKQGDIWVRYTNN